MYDELVKRIQKQAVYLPEKFSKNAELLDVLMQAADAIENLEKQLHAEQEVCDGYYYAYQHWMHQYLKDIGDRDAGVSKTCVDCQRDCQMIGLDMPACTAYELPKEEN